MTDTDASRLDRAAQIRDRRQAPTEQAQPESQSEEPATADAADHAAPTTRLLTVTLGGETYAFDVTTVSEVIEPTSLTRVPTTPPVVAGVTDLRGRVTTVLDPAAVLEPVGTSTTERPIVVFDSDQIDHQGAVGWLVDDVREVVTPTAEEYRDPPQDHEWIDRALQRADGRYVLVIDPQHVFDRAAAAIDAAFSDQ